MLAADWTAHALAGAQLLAQTHEAVDDVLKKLDTCPPIGATGSLVETVARVAGKTQSEARALDLHFSRTIPVVNETLAVVKDSNPSDGALHTLVERFAELDAYSIPLRFPLVHGDRVASRRLQRGPSGRPAGTSCLRGQRTSPACVRNVERTTTRGEQRA